MKYFSLKLFFLCILFPPLLYLLSIQGLEQYLQQIMEEKLGNIYLKDTGYPFYDPLNDPFNRQAALQDKIAFNIDGFIREKRLKEWGIRLNVTVTTQAGTLVYPVGFTAYFREETERRPDYFENYQLLKEQLSLTVQLEILKAGPISLACLLTLISLSLTIIYLHYRAGVRRLQAEERRFEEEIERLQQQENAQLEKMAVLHSEQESMTAEINRMKSAINQEKQQAHKNEAGMIEEIYRLELKLNENKAQQEQQLEEIEALKEEIQLHEKRKETKQIKKEIDLIKKRFRALYKNLIINDRFVAGYSELTEEFKIKAEEIVHQLNDDPKLVVVKRKVFGKKNRETVLEVLFAYKGRLYYRYTLDKKVEILAVGTKNTQSKDLEFLNNL